METALQETWAASQVILPRLAQALVIVIVTLVGMRLLRLAAHRTKSLIARREQSGGRSTRLIALAALAEQVSQVLVVLIAVFTLLGTFGVNLGPILTSLGVVGLGVSLGAQTLIKDYFGGLMILMEDQFVVGEQVTVGPVSGAVEGMTLRLTKLRDANGKLHIIPNGDVRLVTNSSRDWLLAIVDVNLALEADLEQALALLEEAAACAAEDPGLEGALLEPPQVQGWNRLLDWAVQVRLSARTRPNQRIAVEVALRRCALDALQRGSVPLARPVADLRAQS